MLKSRLLAWRPSYIVSSQDTSQNNDFNKYRTCFFLYLFVSQLFWFVCVPMDYNLADSFAHGISQARILEQLPVPSLGLIHRKVLNSLTWDICFVVFFSLIDSNSLKLVFIAKTPYISWLLPYLFEAISLKECIPSSSCIPVLSTK